MYKYRIRYRDHEKNLFTHFFTLDHDKSPIDYAINRWSITKEDILSIQVLSYTRIGH